MSLIKLDHIAFGVTNLGVGIAEMSKLLGAKPIGGGKHALFGTHNAIWRLEGKFATYLEVIAIDPDAPEPQICRWFGLDDLDVQVRIADGPGLLTFIVNTNDILAARKNMPSDPGEPVEVSRGDLKWQFSLQKTGALVENGALPYLIEWPRGPKPVEAMPNQNIRLQSIGGNRLGELNFEWPCEAVPTEKSLEVTLVSASGQLKTFCAA